MKKKITVAIAGLGSRGKDTYAKAAKLFADRMEIVAVADIVPEKVREAAKEYGIPEDRCFDSAESLLREKRLADVLFICTMDRQHYGHAVPALKKGYHLLLEKPVSPVLAECLEIEETAKKYGRHVVVCHVLRYTPFYQELKRLINVGTIGDVVSIQAIENVAYWHQAHSFVRGNWRNSEESSPMILQKSCHDMDILLWLSGKHCKYVSSFGSLRFFKPECAPEGAAMRCLDGCKIKESCPFDAERFYITDGVLKGKSGWPMDVLTLHPTEESIRKALQTGPYGRCVFHCDNNVVDHQVVNLELSGGATVSFTMCAFTSRSHREIKIMGTKGDITASMGDNIIDDGVFGEEHRFIDVKKLASDLSGHAGGDNRMISELLDLLTGEGMKETALTSIEDSLESHYVALAAEYSRLHAGKAVALAEFGKENMV